MKKIILLCSAFFIIISLVKAQNSEDLFMPKELKKAYKEGTRSFDGKPGKNYFQNKTDYAIKAKFSPETRTIEGSETITYKNNSKDSLSNIYIKLYQDLFKKGGARNWDLGSVDIHNGVNIKSLKINNIEIDINSNQVRRRATIMSVKLSEPIPPSSITKIDIEWSSVIPGTVPVRMGTYHKTNFMVAYWYPKMAVYDDIRSWNTIPHTGNCEYYNDFGDFKVEITVPRKYIVWSSGLLQNGDKIFMQNYLEKLKNAAGSDDVIHIVTKDDREKDEITNKQEKHTYKFKAKNIPDFAFAVSNSYLWDATSVQVGKKRVLVHAVYKENSQDFHKVADISSKIIDYFSTKSPGIQFPYPQMVAFNGSGGMEFPGMVNDGDSRNKTGTLYLTGHEIGHTYFPFYTGLNEQRYAWMDEGLISFLPQKVVAEYTNDKDYLPFRSTVEGYNHNAGGEQEVPLMISSTNTGLAYRYHAYIRSSTAFYVLHEMIGGDKFNEGLKEFATRWNGKHPTPYDFFFTFNEVVGEDLAWLWKPWFFELGCADLALGEISNTKGKQSIEIINKGGFPVPISLKIVYKNGDKKNINKSITIWKNGKRKINIELPKGKIKSLSLDSKMTPDAYSENNTLEL